MFGVVFLGVYLNTKERKIRVRENDLKMGSGVTFESILGHSNSFCISVELGARPLLNAGLLPTSVQPKKLLKLFFVKK